METGSAITWKLPSVILQGDDSVGEVYSVAVAAGQQQADTGSKIRIGRNTKSTIERDFLSPSPRVRFDTDYVEPPDLGRR